MTSTAKPYFPDKPVKLDYLYFHLGRVAFNWASVEHSLETCVHVFGRAENDPSFRLPTNTKQRGREFKRLLLVINIPQKERETGQKLHERFAYLAWHRNWTTHAVTPAKSILGDTWRRQKGLVEFHKMNTSTFRVEVLELHLKDLENMGDEALSLASEITDWLTVDLGCSTPKRTRAFELKARPLVTAAASP